MPSHLRIAPSLLVATVLGCSAASSTARPAGSGGYMKIDDMEGAANLIGWVPLPGEVPPGFWFSTTDCSQADRIVPRPATPEQNPWSYSPLPAPHETLPGVMSYTASRLHTTDVPLVGVWGASMAVAFAGNPGAAGGAPGAAGTDDGGSAGAGDAGSAPAPGAPCRQGSALDYPATAVSNLSAYSGVTFWAAVGPGSDTKTIRVQVDDLNTDPRGHRCNPTTPTSDTNCYNGFGTSVTLTETFTQYTVDFASLRQRPSWGPLADALDVEGVYNLDFKVELPACASTPYTMCAGGAPSLAFDFWIDDLYFVKK